MKYDFLDIKKERTFTEWLTFLRVRKMLIDIFIKNWRLYNPPIAKRKRHN